MTRRAQCFLLALALLVALTCSLAPAQDIPASPLDLAFPELTFTPPTADEARIDLPGEIPCFVVTDSAVPVVDVTLHFPFGSFDDPEGKEGLAQLAMELLRVGGTASLTPEELLDELESLAITTASSAGEQTSSFSVSCLTEDLPRAIALLTEIVRTPRLDEARLEVARAQTLELMAHRFDSPDDVASVYVTQALYAGHPAARMASAASVASVTVDDIRAFLSARVHPGGMVIAIGGDLTMDEAPGTLAPLLDGWEALDTPERVLDPSPQGLPPGVYVVNMPTELASIHFAHHGFARHDPDYVPGFYATRLANATLGGGFASRLTQRIRVREGLAYTVYSFAFSNVGYPGLQQGFAGVPAPKAAYAAKVMVDEIDAFREGGPTPQELERDKLSLFGTWVGFFESPARIANDYATLLLEDMPLTFYVDWYRNATDRTADEVTAAAANHIRPADFRWIVVGPADTLLARAAEHDIALEDLGPVTVLELGDPSEAVELNQ